MDSTTSLKFDAGVTCRTAAGVQWVVERTGLILLRPNRPPVRVDYPEAAIWDLLSRPYDFDTTAAMMQHIAALDETAARDLVTKTVNDWLEEGFLERTHGDG